MVFLIGIALCDRAGNQINGAVFTIHIHIKICHNVFFSICHQTFVNQKLRPIPKASCSGSDGMIHTTQLNGVHLKHSVLSKFHMGYRTDFLLPGSFSGSQMGK